MSRQRLVGYASTWSTLTRWEFSERHFLLSQADGSTGPYFRRKQPGALDGVLARKAAVPLLIDHDRGRRITTLRAGENWGVDQHGVWLDVVLPETVLGYEAAELVRSGRYRAASTAYDIGAERLTREGGRPVYLVTRLDTLRDICIATVGRDPKAAVRLID